MNYNLDIKESASTVLCTALIKETVNHYSERDSDCYRLMLDGSKALTEGNMYLHYCVEDHFALLCCDSLCIMYVNQCIQIKWNSMISEKNMVLQTA